MKEKKTDNLFFCFSSISLPVDFLFPGYRLVLPPVAQSQPNGERFFTFDVTTPWR